jgi:2-keto-4-pentenoate hydratase/2-oxohepta-3-ene-1,7-dioic acid hydratase in catechol pathway
VDVEPEAPRCQARNWSQDERWGTTVKFVGVRHGTQTVIGRLFVDNTVAEVADAAEFYADLPGWLPQAASLLGGRSYRTEIEEVPAVPASARVLCVGVNYRSHAEEAGLPIPEHPAFFGRWTVSLVADGTPVPVPPSEPGLDWEVELAAVVGRPLAAVAPDQALAGVFGYAAFNDLSARRHQMHSPLWTLGKNADRSGPFSAVATADEVGDPRAWTAIAHPSQRGHRAGRRSGDRAHRIGPQPHRGECRVGVVRQADLARSRAAPRRGPRRTVDR